MSLPQETRWNAAADKKIASLQKHGVYELVPASFVPAGQKVVGSRWVNKFKADDLSKNRLVVLGWAQVPRINCGGNFALICRSSNHGSGARGSCHFCRNTMME